MTDSIHKLGEVLRAAREAKGVDLVRVERDTKIRTRYLTALESGEYRDLPGAVYTKGFLRNYGLYLGLDPEYLVDLFRLETGTTAPERAPSVPPRPLTVRRARALVVTPGAIFAALLTVGVVLFIGYLGYEFVTFAGTPELRITDPASNVATWSTLSYTIRGTTTANSTVTIEGLRENPTVKADANGNFQVNVRLVPGSNMISLVATDPKTQRDSAKETRMINVVSGGTATPRTNPLTVSAPQAGATLASPVVVSGTALPGAQLTVSASLVSAGVLGFTIRTQFGQPVAVAAPRPGTLVSAKATAGTDGKFIASLTLSAGSWDLSVSAAATSSPSAAATASPGPSATGAVTRRVTVKPPTGLSGTVVVAGGPSYLVVLQDGAPLGGVSGHTIPAGRTIPLTARSSIVLRAGNAGAVTLMINGVTIGKMGGSGSVVEWHIAVAG